MKNNNFENKNLKFIWGIKSPMDLTERKLLWYNKDSNSIKIDRNEYE